jgi:hypothetical protein
MVGTGAFSRRRLLAGLLLVPPALTGCSLGALSRDTAPDPLIALADAARADAALVAALVAARPELAERLTPLRTARIDHATALDAEVAREAGATATPAPPPTPAPAGTAAAVRAAVLASGNAAAAAALTLPAQRVGLVASVAACCAAYAAVLA